LIINQELCDTIIETQSNQACNLQGFFRSCPYPFSGLKSFFKKTRHHGLISFGLVIPFFTIYIANHLLEKQGQKIGKSRKTLDQELLDTLMTNPWEGNIRELGSVIIRGYFLCRRPADNGSRRLASQGIRTNSRQEKW
jgi:hypothetical protein